MNFSPAGTCVLSGKFTSSTKTALYLQAVGAFEVDVDNEVGGISVRTIDPDSVIETVEVAAGALVGVSPETCAQEFNIKRINRTSVIFLIIVFS